VSARDLAFFKQLDLVYTQKKEKTLSRRSQVNAIASLSVKTDVKKEK
jgi:hypothetical protein